MSDIDTVVVDSLKTLDPNRPIREADIREMTLQKQKDRLKTLVAFLKSVSRRGPVNPLPVREPIPPEDCI